MACHEGSHEGDQNGHDDSDTDEWLGTYFCESGPSSSSGTLQRKRKASQEPEIREAKVWWLETKGKEISALILRWFPQTPDDLHSLYDFRTKHNDLFWNDQLFQKVAKVAFKHAKLTFSQQSTRQILEHRTKSPEIYYLDSHSYFNPEFSAHILARLVLEQNGGDIPEAMKFLESVFNVCDKVVPKFNTLCLVSPPSCGKSYFVLSLLNNFWPMGQCQNNVKGGSDFQFQDAVGCRVNLWNECLLQGDAFIDLSKNIWEGLACAVNVKHEKQKLLKRTPLFVTCNKDPWTFAQQCRSAFMDRCFYYRWHKQPWLKKLQSYPVPTAWHIIIENYKRSEWWNDVLTTDVILAERAAPISDYSNWLRLQMNEEEWNDLTTKY